MKRPIDDDDDEAASLLASGWSSSGFEWAVKAANEAAVPAPAAPAPAPAPAPYPKVVNEKKREGDGGKTFYYDMVDFGDGKLVRQLKKTEDPQNEKVLHYFYQPTGEKRCMTSTYYGGKKVVTKEWDDNAKRFQHTTTACANGVLKSYGNPILTLDLGIADRDKQPSSTKRVFVRKGYGGKGKGKGYGGKGKGGGFGGRGRGYGGKGRA